jgi:glycosyltransferase involved in cell wall biosynthesis
MSIKVLCVTADPDRPTTAAFIGMRERGIDLAVVCPANSPGRKALAAAGVPLVDIDVRRSIDRAAIRALRLELRRGNYDILHVFSGKALQNGLLATRGLPVRVIAYRGIVGNVSFLDPASWLRFLNPRIARIICVADAVRDYFLHMRPAFLRLPAERLVTIYKGHDLDWYRDPPADRVSLGVPAESFLIGCVANYRPRKGIEVLVGAIGRLPANWNVHLVLVGRMSSKRLDRAIASSPAASRVHRVGFRPDAPAIAACCDVFVLPSTRREGLARALIEAMVYGVPPVVTDCGGSPELVVDGSCGLVVPPDDAAALAAALSSLYEDPALRRRLGAAARERIGRDFRLETTIQQTMTVYRQVLAE